MGGPSTIAQSVKAVAIEGVISAIGWFGGAKDQLGIMDGLKGGCIVRRILVDSRAQFEEMNRSIEVNRIRPVVDQKSWGFEQAKEVYQYNWEQKNLGKVMIQVI